MLILLAVASALYASLRLFTGFTYYDDEGSLLLMSRWQMDGHAVYRDFQSVYGPFYFLYKWTAHSLLGGSVSHAAARVISVVPWVLTAMVAFGYTLKVTRSRAAALVAWLAVLRTLNFLAVEPGQAQEICILLLMLLVAVAARPAPWRLVAAGALVAALALTKINLGVYAGAGLILAWVSGLPSGRPRTILLASAGAMFAAAPVLLMLPLLSSAEAKATCALLIVSIVPVVAVLALTRQECELGGRHFWAMAAGFAVCVLLVLSWAVLRGASLRAMYHSAVLANLQQAHTWSWPLSLGFLGAAAGVGGPILAGLWLTGRRGRAFEWVRLVLGCSVMLLVLKVQPDEAFALALPFVWMVLLPGVRTDASLWPRSVLAAITVLHAMNVYPVAGSQLIFTLVLLAITAAVNVYDAWSILGRDGMWSSKIMRRAETAAVVLAFAGYVASADVAFGAYAGLPSLDLPGTRGVHLAAEDRKQYHWIVSQVRGTCDSLVSFPAMHSVYFWTGLLPPVYPDVDGWQAYTNAERQAVERTILAKPRSCVLISDPLTRFYLPAGEKTPSTLIGFIREHFVEVSQYKGLHFLVRKR